MLSIIATIAARKLAAVGISAVASLAIPWFVQDKPVLKWTWNKFGPVFVDSIKDKVKDKDEGLFANESPAIEHYTFIPREFNNGIKIDVGAKIIK